MITMVQTHTTAEKGMRTELQWPPRPPKMASPIAGRPSP